MSIESSKKGTWKWKQEYKRFIKSNTHERKRQEAKLSRKSADGDADLMPLKAQLRVPE